MAPSVADISEVWDAPVDSRVPGIADHHDGCEHLRGLIRQGTNLESGEIMMTDCTPREALPQKENGYRQFLRVVMPCVSHWYADHSTGNPKVALPSSVTVVQRNKFVRSLSELEIVSFENSIRSRPSGHHRQKSRTNVKVNHTLIFVSGRI